MVDIVLSVIVPTRNESDNIGPLLRELRRALAKLTCRYEIVFVDDSDDNDTRLTISEEAQSWPIVRLLARDMQDNLSGAIVDGIRAARGEFCIVMDCDLQHDPHAIPRMLKAYEDGADVVICSRYRPGGDDGGFGPIRRFMSTTARRAASVFLSKASLTTDATSGFFGVSKKRAERTGFTRIGWKPLLDILASDESFKVSEVAYRFGARLHGASKMSFEAQIEYLRHLLIIRDGFRIWRLLAPSPCGI